MPTSPNQDARPAGMPIDMLVLHYTGMTSASAAIERLCDPAARVSSHYVLEEDGTVTALVDEGARAYHAGVSFWRGERGLNDRSVGIEIVNPGHDWGYRAFPAVQMTALVGLCRGIMGRHPIVAEKVVGHSDVAPDRKQDPGELFDWALLASHGIGLWPDGNTGIEPVGLDQVAAVLGEIGYPVPDLATTLIAFQRRFLPGRLSGEADLATRRRLAEVHRAYAAWCA